MLCYFYGASRQRLIKQMNRASAEMAQSGAEEEGLKWVLGWAGDFMNEIVQRRWMQPDYEFVFDSMRESDQLKQAQADQIYVQIGAKTVNETRVALGKEPSPEPGAEMLLVHTPTGPVPLTPQEDDDGGDDPDDGGAGPSGRGPRQGGQSGAGGAAGEGGAGGERGAAPGKRAAAAAPAAPTQAPQMTPRQQGARTQMAQQAMEGELAAFLAAAAKAAADTLREPGKARKAANADAAAKRAFDAIGWQAIAERIEPLLQEVVADGGFAGLMQVAVSDAGLINDVNVLAQDYARARAAEMVGKRWVGGKLVDNPNARWAISETTRNDLRQLFTDAFKEWLTIDDLVERIQAATTFSAERARLIAETETSAAQANGNLWAWRKTGLVEEVGWDLSADHVGPDECDLRAKGGPYPIGAVPQFPAHPRCKCALVATKIKSTEAA